jgi:tight adherence protein C
MNGWYDGFLEATSFLTVTGVSLRIAQEVERRIAIRDRMNAGGQVAAAKSVLRNRRVQNRFLNWVQTRTSLSDPAERQKLAGRLAQAGYESPAAPMVYVSLRYGLALGLPLLVILGRSLINAPATAFTTAILPMALCVGSLTLPAALLRRRIANRRTTIEQQFPDALDLIVICMDAGTSLEAAILRVTQEMRRSHPEIAREFERISEELNAGRSRADALHNFANRLDIPSIRGFASLLIQSQALGASISQALKTYAVELRHKRAMIAEEKAMRIPVLISIPLVSCFLPVIVAALMLPAIIDIIRLFGALKVHH